MSEMRLVKDFGPEYDFIQGEDNTTELAEWEGVEWWPYMFLKQVEGVVQELWGVSSPDIDRPAFRIV